MRSGCFFKGLLFFLVLVGAWEGWSWLEAKKSRLTGVRAQSVTTTETLEKLQKEWKTIEQAQTELKALRKREDKATQTRDRISEQQRRLTGEIKYLALSMQETVGKVRKAAIDTKVAELKIEGQATLTNARILKITDDSITFLHEDGVANLQLKAAELQPEFIAKFDIGPNSIHAKLNRLLDGISNARTR